MSYRELLEQIQELSVEEQKAIVNEILNTLNESKSTDTSKPRILGMHAGSTVFVADDFDAELPDSFWLGQDKSSIGEA
jgi:hypothetical protein